MKAAYRRSIGCVCASIMRTILHKQFSTNEVTGLMLASFFDTEENLHLHSYPNSPVNNLPTVLSGSLETCEEKRHERLCFSTDIQFGIDSLARCHKLGQNPLASNRTNHYSHMWGLSEWAVDINYPPSKYDSSQYDSYLRSMPNMFSVATYAPATIRLRLPQLGNMSRRYLGN
jgi:hypothetical protein